MENQEGYARQVHRAEMVGSSLAAKTIDTLVVKFKDSQLGGSMDATHVNNLADNVSDYFVTFSRGYTSVGHMENISVDRGRTVTQNQNAINDLAILGKAVYESVRDNPNFVESIGKGSANEIDEKLPKEFKGAGKIVLTNVFEVGPVREVLENLDEVRGSLRSVKTKSVREKQLTEAVAEAMVELRRLKSLNPSQSYDRQMAMAYLGAEIKQPRPKRVESVKKELGVSSGLEERLGRLADALEVVVGGKPEEKKYEGQIVRTPEKRKDVSGMIW